MSIQTNSSRLPKLPDSSLFKCSKCGETKQRIRAEHKSYPSTGWVFRDELGRPWSSTTCNACKNLRTKIHSRKKYGTVSRDEVQEHGNKKGRESEKMAAEFFRMQGYKVSLVDVQGPDLVLKKGDENITVEVKTVTVQSERSFHVSKMSPHRINDDIIAYVHGEVVIVRSMKSHMEQCGGRDCNVSKFFVNPKNSQNTRVSKDTGLKGVRKASTAKNRFTAYIAYCCKQLYLGTFDTKREAAEAYNAKAKELFGEFAVLNKL